jgi:hypothetical protein
MRRKSDTFFTAVVSYPAVVTYSVILFLWVLLVVAGFGGVGNFEN